MFGIIRQAHSILQRACFNAPRLVSARNYSELDEDGDLCGMKSTVSFVNDDVEGLFINGFSQLGFLLNNGLRVIGPCAIFPRSILHWNVRDVEDIGEESLSLFTMLEPKLDILVLGVGDYEEVPKLNINVIKHLQSHKINVEVLSTEAAVSTFNFLSQEKRYVAGAFIPPLKVETFEDLRYLQDNKERSSIELDMLKVVDRVAKLKSKKYKQLRDKQDKDAEASEKLPDDFWF